LNDIPAELLDGINPWQTYRTPQRRTRRAARWDAGKQAASAPIIQPQFSAGQNVRHPTYGEGMVLKTEIDDGEEIVDVFFEEGGLKKLVASLARLEILEE
jgi:DNA helicase-2/ATP-dependent DNA helicase PcrA